MSRPLTQREADRCENARTPVCRCRCGGAFHGKGRVPDGDFSKLPPEDPHYRPPKVRKKSFSELIAEAREQLAVSAAAHSHNSHNSRNDGAVEQSANIANSATEPSGVTPGPAGERRA